MSESTKQYNIQGSRVYGKGWSYNLTNQTDAAHLQNTLNNYETTINDLKKQNNITNNYNEIKNKLEKIEYTLNEIKEALK